MNNKRKFSLEHENVIDFNAFNEKLIRTYWVLVIIVVATQLVDSALLIMSGEYEHRFGHFTYLEYILNQIIIPVSLMLINMVATMFASKFFARRKQFLLQSFVCIINITITAVILTTAHYMISGIFMIFTFPSIVSFVYIDRKPIIFALIISVSTYLMTAIFFLFPKAAAGEIVHGVMELVTTLAFICVGTSLAIYALSVKKLLIKQMLDEKRKSKIDSLTGLLNHAAFYEQLDKSFIDIKNNREHAEPLSIIIWDLDSFKSVNDLFGHSIGDQVILAFVSALNNVAEGKGQAFRYGGEEFAFIARKNAQETFEIAEAVRKEFEICSKLDCFPKGLTVSGGICEHSRESSIGKRELFAAADEALYSAKKAGKNKTVIYSAR
ncbi:MAG: GGDEF domain-containing protein [Fibromonadaceae bacterium]|jgi:diguanylate cyclase (GGDEF)-like protein|nr:GGDEF domain-containing protein [Fibromonadaceae bacterium]